MHSTTNRPTTDRALRAYEQASEYLVLPLNPGANDWDVSKISTGTSYRVDLDRATCTCPDHVRRGIACKHLHLARFHAAADAQVPEPIAEALAAAQEATRRAQVLADRALWD